MNFHFPVLLRAHASTTIFIEIEISKRKQIERTRKRERERTRVRTATLFSDGHALIVKIFDFSVNCAQLQLRERRKKRMEKIIPWKLASALAQPNVQYGRFFMLANEVNWWKMKRYAMGKTKGQNEKIQIESRRFVAVGNLLNCVLFGSRARFTYPHATTQAYLTRTWIFYFKIHLAWYSNSALLEMCWKFFFRQIANKKGASERQKMVKYSEACSMANGNETRITEK